MVQVYIGAPAWRLRYHKGAFLRPKHTIVSGLPGEKVRLMTTLCLQKVEEQPRSQCCRPHCHMSGSSAHNAVLSYIVTKKYY